MSHPRMEVSHGGMLVGHVAVALYILVELAGLWIAILSLLLYVRRREAAFLYFAMFFGSSMIMLVAEIILAYWQANGMDPAPWLLLVRRGLYFTGEMLHFYGVFYLAYALVRIPMSVPVRRAHLLALAFYAAATIWLIAAGSSFELQHVVLRSIQIISIGTILANRHRIIPPGLRRLVLQLVGVALVFAPMIGITVYTSFASRLPFGGMTTMIGYAIVAEILLTWHGIGLLFKPVATSSSHYEASPRE